MPDVIEILHDLPHAAGVVATSPDVVAADLARGHRAAARRRRQRLAISGTAVAVVAAGAVGLSQAGAPVSDSGRASGPASGPVTVTSGSTAPVTAPKLELVAYTGTQPAGFTVSTVPQDWKVVSSDPSAFVVEPPGMTPDPSPAPGALSLRNRIAVTLQSMSRFPAQRLTTVDVNGRAGQLGHPLESPGKLSDTWWLFFPDGAGHKILVQVEPSVGLDQAGIARFAKGIAVTGQAQPIGG